MNDPSTILRRGAAALLVGCAAVVVAIVLLVWPRLFDGTPDEEQAYHEYWKELNRINPSQDCSTCHR